MRRLLLLATPVADFGQIATPDDIPRPTALFDADQHDRMPPAGRAIDWSKVRPADDARRPDISKMVDTGATPHP